MEELKNIENTNKKEESDIILNDRLIIIDNENGKVTLPEKTLANLNEALSYTRKQEMAIMSKLRESNEYVIGEMKDMLNNAFEGGFLSDKIDESEMGHRKSAVCDDYSFEHDKSYYVEGPIKFLSEYEGSLKNLMNLVAEELKLQKDCNSFPIICKRFGVPEDEFLNMDTESIIELVKKDIKNIPSLNPSTCCNNINQHLGAGEFYLDTFYNVFKKLGYK